MSLCTLQEVIKDREAWSCSAWGQKETELNNSNTTEA